MTSTDASDVSVEQRLEATWEQLLAHRFAERAEPQEHPEAVLIVGLPCSGKSVLAETVRREFAARGGAVSIDLTDLQLLHPAAGVPKARRSHDIDNHLVSSTGYAAARMLIAATDRRQNLVAACRIEAEANAAALVEDLHQQGYPVTILVPIVARDVSWHRLVESAKSSVGESLPELDRAQFDRLCDVLVEALVIVEKQGVADSISWIDSAGRVLGSMKRGADWTIGTSRRIFAEHAPAIGARGAPSPSQRPPRDDERDPEYPQRAHPLEPVPEPLQSTSSKRNGRRSDSDQDRQLDRRREFLRILQLRAESEAKGRG